jgi:hypothetical protein
MHRIIAALFALVLAFGTVFSAWLTQGAIDGRIAVVPFERDSFGIDSRTFLIAVGVTLTSVCLLEFIAFGWIASKGTEQ